MMAALNLVDINSIKIDRKLPVKKRTENLIKQLKDPYNFKHGDVKIHINFVGSSSLEDKVIEIYKNT